MAIGELKIGSAKGDDLEVTLRGNADAIIRVLVNGMERDDLVIVHDAIAKELANRREAAAALQAVDEDPRR